MYKSVKLISGNENNNRALTTNDAWQRRRRRRRMEWVTFNWFDFGLGNGDWLKPNDWFYSSIYPKYTHTRTHIIDTYLDVMQRRDGRAAVAVAFAGWVVWIICLLSVDRLFHWNHITQKAAAAAAKAPTKTAHTHKQTNTFHHAKLLYHWTDRYESVFPIRPQSVFCYCSTIIIYSRVWMCFDTAFLCLFVRAFV